LRLFAPEINEEDLKKAMESRSDIVTTLVRAQQNAQARERGQRPSAGGSQDRHLALFDPEITLQDLVEANRQGGSNVDVLLRTAEISRQRRGR